MSRELRYGIQTSQKLSISTTTNVSRVKIRSKTVDIDDELSQKPESTKSPRSVSVVLIIPFYSFVTPLPNMIRGGFDRTMQFQYRFSCHCWFSDIFGSTLDIRSYILLTYGISHSEGMRRYWLNVFREWVAQPSIWIFNIIDWLRHLELFNYVTVILHRPESPVYYSLYLCSDIWCHWKIFARRTNPCQGPPLKTCFPGPLFLPPCGCS